MPAKPRVFISYARSDDLRFVKRLYNDLTRLGYDVWWDIVSMPSRGVEFTQEIRDAIEACDRLIEVIGPASVKSVM